eukprot:Polyplicarium_translucidae@DN2806_c1_g1_i1.p1
MDESALNEGIEAPFLCSLTPPITYSPHGASVVLLFPRMSAAEEAFAHVRLPPAPADDAPAAVTGWAFACIARNLKGSSNEIEFASPGSSQRSALQRPAGARSLEEDGTAGPHWPAALRTLYDFLEANDALVVADARIRTTSGGRIAGFQPPESGVAIIISAEGNRHLARRGLRAAAFEEQVAALASDSETKEARLAAFVLSPVPFGVPTATETAAMADVAVVLDPAQIGATLPLLFLFRTARELGLETVPMYSALI